MVMENALVPQPPTHTGPARYPELNAQTLHRLDAISTIKKKKKKVNPRSKKKPSSEKTSHFPSWGWVGLDPSTTKREMSEETIACWLGPHHQ